ncbi:MAG: endonuclease domain-containing protein [Candidatus Portnoybacteria bacterium]
MNPRHIYNNRLFKQRRSELRKNQTEAEKVLWRCIRDRQIAGFKFFRQYSVGAYILDFYCPRARLTIELDGGHHADKDNQDYDQARTSYLARLNIFTIRFWNNEVLDNMDNVLEVISKEILRK